MSLVTCSQQSPSVRLVLSALPLSTEVNLFVAALEPLSRDCSVLINNLCTQKMVIHDSVVQLKLPLVPLAMPVLNPWGQLEFTCVVPLLQSLLVQPDTFQLQIRPEIIFSVPLLISTFVLRILNVSKLKTMLEFSSVVDLTVLLEFVQIIRMLILELMDNLNTVMVLALFAQHLDTLVNYRLLFRLGYVVEVVLRQWQSVRMGERLTTSKSD